MQRCSIFHGDETTPNNLIRKVLKSIQTYTTDIEELNKRQENDEKQKKATKSIPGGE